MPANIPSLDVDAWADDLDTLLDAAAAFTVATLRYANAPHILTRQEADLSRERLGDLKRRYTARLTALASTLAGMGKDSERLDALESWTKGDQTICPPGNHGGENTHWLLARDDDAKGDRYGIWSETTEGPTLREAIDAARAAQPQETSADAE